MDSTDLTPESRPEGPRSLNIYDLPAELLMGTFRHLRNCDDIKNLRLSSRRLNKTSSHLLMSTLHVSPNPKSLERLDQVSRHPAISKGVRRLVASVDVYDPDLAGNLRTFTTRCAEALQLEASSFVLYPAKVKAWQIWQSWRYFTETFSAPNNDGAHLDEHNISAVYNGWLQYRKQHREQQLALCDRGYSKDIASAIGRMACLNDLVIRDRSRSSTDEQFQNSNTHHKLEDLVGNPTRLVEEMMLHTLSWQDARVKGLTSSPTHLLYEIPLAIHSAGSSLAHLKFDLTPPGSFRLFDGSELYQLVSFAEGLKSFNLSVAAEEVALAGTTPPRDEEKIENFARFLTFFTRSSELKTLTLDFAFQERDCLHQDRWDDPMRTSIAPFMVDWQRHQSIHLKNCSITLKELRTFVRLPRKTSTVLGLWNVYLLEGTWAEVVELLRSKVLSGRLSQGSVSNLLASSSSSKSRLLLL